MSGGPEHKTLFVRASREPSRVAVAGSGRSATTSDVRRGRTLAAVAGSAGALTLVAAFAAPPAGGLAPGRALAPPHARAEVGCQRCHGEAGEGTAAFRAAAQAACTTCHGAHDSSRSPHARLAAAGTLRCTTCHTIHAPLQGGVRFARDGAASRFVTGLEVPVSGPRHATGREVLVSAVPLAACRTCHAPQATLDVAAACDDGTGYSACFDEHQVSLPAGASDVGVGSRRGGSRGRPGGSVARATGAPVGGVCADQHQPDRAFSHDAARQVLRITPDPRGASAALSGQGGPVLWLGAGGLGAALGWAGVATAEAVRRRRRRTPATAAPPPQHAAAGASARKLLPTIDTSTCLGCYACVDACPYGVLEVERYVAVLARPEACCGLTLCEQRCPNGSLRMVEGEPEEDRLRLRPTLESEDVGGLFLAGDVTAVPLIKNAIAQGSRAADGVARSLEGAAPVRGAVDVAIVGAGPAGLAAALRAKELGLSYVALDQGTVAHSIRSFPRAKLVFDQPLDLPVAGKLWMRESTKEELLGHWLRIVRREGLEVREHVRLTGLSRRDGAFSLQLAPGDGAPDMPLSAISARRVIVAIGRRGTPRRLPMDVPEALEPVVHYHLADARSFAGQRAIVVGLGDVAMEAALALAGQPGTSVTILHRGATYTRGQRRNIDALGRQQRAGRVELLFESSVEALLPGTRGAVARVQTPRGAREVPFDSMFVLIGSIPPRDLLGRLGLRFTGEAASPAPARAAPPR